MDGQHVAGSGKYLEYTEKGGWTSFTDQFEKLHRTIRNTSLRGLRA